MGTIGNFIERDGDSTFIALAVEVSNACSIELSIDSDSDLVFSLGASSHSHGLELNDHENCMSALSLSNKTLSMKFNPNPARGAGHMSLQCCVRGKATVMKGSITAPDGATVQANTTKGSTTLKNGRFQVEL